MRGLARARRDATCGILPIHSQKSRVGKREGSVSAGPGRGGLGFARCVRVASLPTKGFLLERNAGARREPYTCPPARDPSRDERRDASGDVAPSFFSGITLALGPKARRETKEHAPRDAARKDTAGATVRALMVKEAILFQVAAVRGAAERMHARQGARSFSDFQQPPDRVRIYTNRRLGCCRNSFSTLTQNPAAKAGLETSLERPSV